MLVCRPDGWGRARRLYHVGWAQDARDSAAVYEILSHLHSLNLRGPDGVLVPRLIAVTGSMPRTPSQCLLSGSVNSSFKLPLLYADNCAGCNLDLMTSRRQLIGAVLLLKSSDGLPAQCNGVKASYLFQPDKPFAELDTGDNHIQCGRRNDVLKYWMVRACMRACVVVRPSVCVCVCGHTKAPNVYYLCSSPPSLPFCYPRTYTPWQYTASHQHTVTRTYLCTFRSGGLGHPTPRRCAATYRAFHRCLRLGSADRTHLGCDV